MLRNTHARLNYLVALAALAVTPSSVHALRDGTADTATVRRPPLEIKNREANELRARAEGIRAELMDKTKDFTVDEVQTKLAGIRSLEMRAAAGATFTPDAEIERQRAGEGLEAEEREALGLRGEGGEEAETQRTAPHMGRRKAASVLIKELSDEVVQQFGNLEGYMRAVTGNSGQRLTSKQERTVERAKLLTRAIVGTANDSSGGEFLLPLTQVASIFSLQNVQQGILQRARTFNVPGRTLRIPYLIQDTADSTKVRPMAGSIANVQIIGEGSGISVREPSFGQRLLTVYKYAAVTQVGQETLNDDFTGELPTEFTNAVGQQALNRVNEDVTIDGTGSSMPTGALYASQGALLTVPRNTNATIKAPDVFAMYERHTHGPNSFWLVSRRTLSQIFALNISGTLVTWIQNMNAAPVMQLLGLPVVISDLLPTLNTQSDFNLINPDFYAVALRQALTIESSREYAFVNDLMTYKFIVRAGGIPIPTGTYAYKSPSGTKTDPHSPFVALAAGTP